MSARWRRAAAGVALLAGCADDEWRYRPRDAGAGRIDVGVTMPDGAMTDRGVVREDGTAGPLDVPTGEDGATDAGTPPTGITVRAAGLATAAGGSATAGTLRLSETGFEVGERVCVGTLCAAGGLVP